MWQRRFSVFFFYLFEGSEVRESDTDVGDKNCDNVKSLEKGGFRYQLLIN